MENKEMGENTQASKLLEVIESMSRKKIVSDLASLTLSDQSTVYRWINGTSVPPTSKKRIIADYFKIPVFELFPEN